MDKIIKKIKNDRPNLKDNSINAYKNSLLKICRELTKEKTTCDIKNLNFLKNTDKVFDIINNDPITTQKNRLTAIIVFLNTDKKKYEKQLKIYSDKLKKLTDEYNGTLEKQEKTDKQRENWIEYEELIEIIDSLFSQIKEQELNKKDTLNKKQYKLLMEYVLLKTILTFPIRNDYADMKVLEENDYDEKKDKENYLILKDKKPYQFILNEYKTQDQYGKKVLDIPKPLSNIIKLFLKHNNSGYFVTQMQDKSKPLNSNSLTKFIQNIFLRETKKKIGSSMLRHIIISHELKGTSTINEIKKKEEEIESKYLHSREMNQKYRKID